LPFVNRQLFPHGHFTVITPTKVVKLTMAKEFMDDYAGVKFRAIQIAQQRPPGFGKLFPLFKATTDDLRAHNMTSKNAGNISMRFAGGVAITSSGANLGILEEEEVVFVRCCSLDDHTVEYIGPNVPSSETFMHYQIYQSRPDAGAVVHAHDPATATLAAGEVKETAKEEPYGTLALATMACETFSRDERIIVLKNHGYVAIGGSLEEATDLIVATHRRLLEKKP
jgi:ribulose-5-phosphate 4-epimerase/fuculose-1-phosphate aldolase